LAEALEKTTDSPEVIQVVLVEVEMERLVPEERELKETLV
jgi:hypothetical protein